MSDLIRREDAIEVAYQLRHKPNDDEWNDEWLRSLNAIPTIDAVSVVRCGECKNAFNVEGEWICNHLSGMVGLNVVVKADDFCSYAERSE